MKKIIIIVLFAALSSFIFCQEVIIIAHKDVAAASLTSDYIGKVFLGKKQKWDNGQKIKTVTLKKGPVHDAFLKKYVKKTAAQFTTFWKKIIFAGIGTPPRSFAAEAELAAYVASTPGAIGYVSAAQEGVKEIKITTE